jgi:hypothetical protein
MSVVFGREVDGQFLGIAVSWHYGSAIGAVLAWVGLTLGIAQRLERGPAAASSATRLPANNHEACDTCSRGYTVSWVAGVLHACWSSVAAIVWTNGEFAASFTASDFSSTMRECVGGLAVSVRTKESGRNVLYSRRCCTPDGRGVCTYAELLLL